MTTKKNEEMAVAALQIGAVIDHNPTESLFKVVDLLGISGMKSSVTIGFNLNSKKCGKKGIIKVADVFLHEDTLNRIALVAPNANINNIRDYKVDDKHTVSLPDDIYGIVKCNNPKCITNNEPMPTRFHVIDKDRCVIKCHYCEKEQSREDITIL